MKQHITRIASNCFHHLRRLRQIRRSDNVGEHVTSHLISAFRLSWLDYCNSLLAGLPRTSIEPLQRVQNATGRLVLNWSSWSRDISTEAATLVTCQTQNQIQAVYIDASNPHWVCTTVLGSLCAVNCWIQSSTPSEICQHCWLHHTSHSELNSVQSRWSSSLKILTWQH